MARRVVAADVTCGSIVTRLVAGGLDRLRFDRRIFARSVLVAPRPTGAAVAEPAVIARATVIARAAVVARTIITRAVITRAVTARTTIVAAARAVVVARTSESATAVAPIPIAVRTLATLLARGPLAAFGRRGAVGHKQRASAELDLAEVIDADDLHFDVVADAHHVGDGAHKAIRQLGDVHHALLARQDLDEARPIRPVCTPSTPR